MNSKDRGHLAQIHQQADFLMNGKENGITTADVVEAMLWDVQLAESGRAPEALPALVEIEQKALLAQGYTSNYASASATLEA